MNLEPQNFFIGLVDFFSVLMQANLFKLACYHGENRRFGKFGGLCGGPNRLHELFSSSCS